MKWTGSGHPVARFGCILARFVEAAWLATKTRMCGMDGCCDDASLVHTIRDGADYARAPAVMRHVAKCAECQQSYLDINELLALGGRNRLREAMADPDRIAAVVRKAVRRRRRETLVSRWIRSGVDVGVGIGVVLTLTQAPSAKVQSAAGALRTFVATADGGGHNLVQRFRIAGRYGRLGIEAIFGSAGDAVTAASNGRQGATPGFVSKAGHLSVASGRTSGSRAEAAGSTQGRAGVGNKVLRPMSKTQEAPGGPVSQ